MAKGKIDPSRLGHKRDWRSVSPSENKPKNVYHSPVNASFQHYQGGRYCYTTCEGGELKEAIDMLRQLTSTSWSELKKQCGKPGNKTGLAYTEYRDSDLHRVSRPSSLSNDVKLSSLRVSQKMRVYGAYIDHTYYILWFDRNHEIYPVD